MLVVCVSFSGKLFSRNFYHFINSQLEKLWLYILYFPRKYSGHVCMILFTHAQDLGIFKVQLMHVYINTHI